MENTCKKIFQNSPLFFSSNMSVTVSKWSLQVALVQTINLKPHYSKNPVFYPLKLIFDHQNDI